MDTSSAIDRASAIVPVRESNMPQTRPTGPPLTRPASNELEAQLVRVLTEHAIAIYFATDPHEESKVTDSERIESDPKLL